MGFVAARWRRADDLEHLDEWGLGGRSFGSWITWFLLGGDLYTAYTFVAVPALMFGAGAVGFFAVPYTIVIYPLVFLVLIRLWSVVARARLRHPGRLRPGPASARRRWRCWSRSPASSRRCPTSRCSSSASRRCSRRWASPAHLADHHRVRHPRGLHLPVRPAGAGADRVRQGHADLPRRSSSRSSYIPLQARRLGRDLRRGRGEVRRLAERRPTASLLERARPAAVRRRWRSARRWRCSSTRTRITGVLASRNRDVIKRNMAALPAYSLLLGLIALLGYMAIAAGIKPIVDATASRTATRSCRCCSTRCSRAGSPGVAFAAIGIGALVPAAIMSIAAANLFTRNIYKEYLNKDATPDAGGARSARSPRWWSSSARCSCILVLDPQFSIDLQLIGGVIILQTLPAVALGLYTRWFHRAGLIAGWVAGMAAGLLDALRRSPNPATRQGALRRLGVPAVEARLRHQDHDLRGLPRAGRSTSSSPSSSRRSCGWASAASCPTRRSPATTRSRRATAASGRCPRPRSRRQAVPANR